MLFFALETLFACQFAFNFFLFIVNLKFSFGFSFIKPFLLIQDFLTTLLSLLRIVILLFLKRFIDILNLIVQLLFLLPKFIVPLLFLDLSLHPLFELRETLLVFHFVLQLVHQNYEVLLVAFDQSLIALHVWVLLELPHQFSRWVLQVFWSFL